MRYASDKTDAAEALIAALMRRVNPIGRPLEMDPRAVVNGIFYLAATVCQRRPLPRSLLPFWIRLKDAARGRRSPVQSNAKAGRIQRRRGSFGTFSGSPDKADAS